MEMTVENHPGMDAQALLLATVFERAHENIAAGGRREDGQPLNDRRGDALGGVFLVDAGATARGTGRRRNGVSQTSAFPNRVWERGGVRVGGDVKNGGPERDEG